MHKEKDLPAALRSPSTSLCVPCVRLFPLNCALPARALGAFLERDSSICNRSGGSFSRCRPAVVRVGGWALWLPATGAKTERNSSKRAAATHNAPFVSASTAASGTHRNRTIFVFAQSTLRWQDAVNAAKRKLLMLWCSSLQRQPTLFRFIQPRKHKNGLNKCFEAVTDRMKIKFDFYALR